MRMVWSKPAKVGVVVATAAAAATALGAGVAASGSKPRPVPAASSPAPTAASTTTVATTPTTTTTIDSVPPATPIAVPATGLAVGSSGPAVAAVKARLAQLRYDPGTTDKYDYPLYYAVVAFQKANGLPRTGKVSPEVAAAMATAPLPKAILPSAEPNRVEIDLTRQVLLYWQDGKLLRILPVSSGFGGHYCGDDGSCGIATTPTGAFRATSKIKGAHKSPLGELWDPVFFNGGIAIHGEPSVPSTPASHGCVRIPMNDSTWMYNGLALGTPVYVADSTHIPVPFNQGGTLGPRQPGGTPPTIPRTTTTKPAATNPATTTSVPAATTATTAKPTTAPTTTVKPATTVPKPAAPH
jgi:lipoprotein-anchoring transpeptidase ErfK/SrfK